MSVEKRDEGSVNPRILNRNGAFVQSVDRAISVMELLSRQGWSGVTEVADELGIHKSTAYRLLSTLKERRLVEQDAVSEKYRLGFGLVLLASAVTEDIDIVRHARPVCERLSEQLEETVTVAVLEGDEAVIIHQTMPETSSVLNVDWSGQHTPLHCTADGKVLLAHLPNERRQRILRRKLERYTEDTIVDAAALREQLKKILADGYSYTVEELEVGLNGVGAPIFDSVGQVVAAISVSGPAFRMSERSIPEIGGLAKQATAEISRQLGFHGQDISTPG